MNVNFSDGKWLNEPTRWHVDHTGLTLTTDEKTDFWRKTYYGFTRDSGHFLGFPTADSFTCQSAHPGRIPYALRSGGHDGAHR